MELKLHLQARSDWERKHKPGIPAAVEWEKHRATITQLYLSENPKLKLGEVRECMAEIYNFYANETQYKNKFKKWGLEKNLSKRTVLAMLQIKDKRALEGKPTKFIHNGQSVGEDKLERSRRRLGHGFDAEPESLGGKPIPPNVEYCTPSPQTSHLIAPDENFSEPINGEGGQDGIDATHECTPAIAAAPYSDPIPTYLESSTSTKLDRSNSMFLLTEDFRDTHLQGCYDEKVSEGQDPSTLDSGWWEELQELVSTLKANASARNNDMQIIGLGGFCDDRDEFRPEAVVGDEVAQGLDGSAWKSSGREGASVFGSWIEHDVVMSKKSLFGMDSQSDLSLTGSGLAFTLCRRCDVLLSTIGEFFSHYEEGCQGVAKPQDKTESDKPKIDEGWKNGARQGRRLETGILKHLEYLLPASIIEAHYEELDQQHIRQQEAVPQGEAELKGIEESLEAGLVAFFTLINLAGTGSLDGDYSGEGEGEAWREGGNGLGC